VVESVRMLRAASRSAVPESSGCVSSCAMAPPMSW
jgi:hypothetical protein